MRPVSKKSRKIKLTLIVVRSFSLVPSMNVWQSSLSLFELLKIPFVALSITISIPLNVSCTFWLKFSNSSLSKMSHCRTEIPGAFGEMSSDLLLTPLTCFPFTKMTWHSCFDDSCSANTWDKLVSPFVI